MSWVITGLATVGATAGYFGTSKKNRGKKGLKNAALGAVGGATLGIGAGAMGIGAGASSATGLAGSGASVGAGTVGAGSTPFAMATPAGYAGSITPGMTSATQMSMAPASSMMSMAPAGTSATSTAAKAGMISKFMSNPIAQGVMTNQISGMLGGGEKEQVQPAQMQKPQMSEWSQGQVNPDLFSSMPLAMKQEAIRRYLNGQPQ